MPSLFISPIVSLTGPIPPTGFLSGWGNWRGRLMISWSWGSAPCWYSGLFYIFYTKSKLSYAFYGMGGFFFVGGSPNFSLNIFFFGFFTQIRMLFLINFP